MGVIYVPVALFLNRFYGVAGIFAACAIANIVTGAIAYAWARSVVPAQCDRHQGPGVQSGTA